MPHAKPDLELRVLPVATKKDLDRFLAVPRRIFAADPQWVPPFLFELKERLDPRKNPYFEHAELQAWVALRGNEAVGRISAQIDHLVPEHHGEQIGHFGFFDSIDDPAVSAALLQAAEAWLREKGMRRVLGPYNPTISEEPGILVEGFTKPPMMLMGHSLPYYAGHLEANGYAKAQDLYAYYLDIRDDSINPGILKLNERYKASGRLSIRQIRMSHYEEDLKIILDILNDAWDGNWGYIPMTSAELTHTATSMKQLIHPEFAYIAYSEGRPIGFMINLPNLNEIMKEIDGRLLPFGWARLVWWLKNVQAKTCRVPLMGVLKEVQNSPLGAATAFSLIEQIRRNSAARGIEFAELSWILESNPRMRGILEKIGTERYKTYRVYGKEFQE